MWVHKYASVSPPWVFHKAHFISHTGWKANALHKKSSETVKNERIKCLSRIAERQRIWRVCLWLNVHCISTLTLCFITFDLVWLGYFPIPTRGYEKHTHRHNESHGVLWCGRRSFQSSETKILPRDKTSLCCPAQICSSHSDVETVGGKQ